MRVFKAAELPLVCSKVAPCRGVVRTHLYSLRQIPIGLLQIALHGEYPSQAGQQGRILGRHLNCFPQFALGALQIPSLSKLDGSLRVLLRRGCALSEQWRGGRESKQNGGRANHFSPAAAP